MFDHAKGCFDSKDLWTRVSTYLERAINGTLAGKSAIVTRAIVDHAGDLPAAG